MNKHGVDDMVMLSSINDDSINGNLEKRFAKDIIYTYIGHVLISVNPFRMIPKLYDEDTLYDYRGKYRFEMPPHVYATADDMYRSMLNERESQCVIISGESGAGKTEASKKILQFVAAMSGRGEDVSRVKDVILDSNPLLEAFGNAKTIRNNNSSRFGKYMEIQFAPNGDPQGGRVTNYLLEKSRVSYQANSERNFHIFYQLIKGADQQLRGDLQLQDSSYYFYTNQGNSPNVDNIDDVAEYNDTCHAMNTMGLTPQEQHAIWKILAAILYLGNVQFTENDSEQSQVANPDTINMVAYLLDTDAMSASAAVCSRTITTTAKRGSTYAVPLNAVDAVFSRDALAKAIYSRLFDFIVEKVNQCLGWSMDGYEVLGILDIYGFEIFDINGFEQLCINYVNEKLQQIFINLTLKEEQEEYGREGIQWEPIQFFNNKICCDLIESKPDRGIFTLLDDTCNFPSGTPEKFLGSLRDNHSTHPHLQVRSHTFVIDHYAGEVEYSADLMLEKNTDNLFNDHIILCQCSDNIILPGLFPDDTSSKKRPTSASSKIKTSITALVDALSRCHPHYIRCIKPNDNKRGGEFNTKRVLHQVKYLGLAENVKVRRAGYAYRHLYDKFFYRYAITCDQTWPIQPWIGRFREGTIAILEALGITSTGSKPAFSPGTTKIFIRAPETVFNLEELRERKTYIYASRIQRFFLKHAMEAYTYKLKRSANDEVRDKKDRRRLSLNRTFYGDYINYKENFALKSLVGKDVKAQFADVVDKYDKRGKSKRFVFIVTDADVFLFSIGKNKDKATKTASPFVYILSQRFKASAITNIVFSTLADNFFVLKLQGGEPDLLLSNRKKVELISVFKKVNSGINYQFQDNISILLKKNKTYNVFFTQDPSAPEGGTIKGKNAKSPPGEGKSAYPDIKEPVKVTHTRTEYVPSTNQNNNTGNISRVPPVVPGGGNNRGPPPARRLPPPM